MHKLSKCALFLIASLFVVLPLQSFAQESTATTPADQARALVEVLRDDAAREAIINELEKISGNATAPALAEATQIPAAETTIPEEKMSLGRQLANFTKQASESFASSLETLGNRLSSTGNTLSSIGGTDTASLLWDALREMAFTILVTYVVFYTLRALALPFYRYMGRQSDEGGLIKIVTSVTISTLVDLAVVLAAWTLGYVIAIYLLGTNGQIGIRQTLYLNAFLIVEVIKVAMRTVLSPSTEKLRWVDIATEAAKYLNSRLNLLVSIIGYGHLLILPIVNLNISRNAGTAIGLIIALLALGISLYLVLRNKNKVANWLTDANEDAQKSFRRNLALHWHIPMILYLGLLFILVVTRPDGVLIPVLIATGKILLAVLAGMVVVSAISRTLNNGIQVPESLNTRLPLLKPRLNKFVPSILMVIRALIFVFIALVMADVIGLLNTSGWLQSQVGAAATASIISTLFILAIAFLVWLAMSSWIDYRLNPETGTIATSREITLLSLFRNAGTIAIFIITLMFALSELGVDIAPLIASAGVLGLAIGFGAQKLVQDIITGIFIQFENAINVGDVITLNGTTGGVERLTIRSVSLRDVEGAYHIIPFSSVDMVTNYMREFAYFKCDMGVAYRENTEEVREAMTDAYTELVTDEAIANSVLAEMEWMGVQAFGDNAVVMRARIKTLPGKQWGIGRAYNAIVKRIFDERGIEMPFPHRTIYFGEDKEGNAPAGPLVIAKRDSDKK